MKFFLKISLILTMILFLSACDLVTSEDGPYQINFISNGGTEVASLKVDAFDPFLPGSVPEREGYLFAGWYIDENLLYPMAFNAGTNEALTLYAKWISEAETLSEEAIRVIIEDILADEDLILTDEVTIEGIITELLESGGAIDTEAVIEAVLENIDVVLAFEQKISLMLAEVKQSVVMVETYSGGSVDGGGSGVIYKRVGNTYYVLTNEHVVSGYTSNNFSITIFTETGDVLIPKGSITLHGTSLEHDMAVLSFTSTSDFRVIEMGTKAGLRVGQFVFAIGSPLDLPNTATMGMISAIDREMSDDYGMDTITIQHTAPINPGNSGGALVDANGLFIGLNNMSYVDEVVGEGIEGLHFAIQIDIILANIDSLE